MKVIFLIVLLANIIFFLWEYNAPSLHSEQSTQTQNKQKLKQIFLLSEVKKQSKKSEIPPTIIVSELKTILNAVAEPPSDKVSHSNIIQPNQPIDPIAIDKTASEQATVKSKSKHTTLKAKIEKEQISQANIQKQSFPPTKTFCYKIGPFQDKNSLDQWLALNKSTISRSFQIEKSDLLDSKYLVYSPATGNIEQSKENIQKFQKMGIDNLWLFRKGELEGAISFGLFSKENRALDLQNKLSAKGLDAKIIHTDMTASPLYLQIFTEKERLKSIFNTNNKQIIAECEND